MIQLEKGKVEKLVIYNDYIYAIIRKKSKESFASNPETGYIGDELVGANRTPENILCLAEVLIPTNILASHIMIDPKNYIGREVLVIMDKNTPVLALLDSSSALHSPREIDSDRVRTIRKANLNKDVNIPSEVNEVASKIFSEKWQDIIDKDSVIRYSDLADWTTNYEDGFFNTATVLNPNKIALKNPQKRTSNGKCYLPKILIGGRR